MGQLVPRVFAVDIHGKKPVKTWGVSSDLREREEGVGRRERPPAVGHLEAQRGWVSWCPAAQASSETRVSGLSLYSSPCASCPPSSHSVRRSLPKGSLRCAREGLASWPSYQPTGLSCKDEPALCQAVPTHLAQPGTARLFRGEHLPDFLTGASFERLQFSSLGLE